MKRSMHNPEIPPCHCTQTSLTYPKNRSLLRLVHRSAIGHRWRPWSRFLWRRWAPLSLPKCFVRIPQDATHSRIVGIAFLLLWQGKLCISRNFLDFLQFTIPRHLCAVSPLSSWGLDGLFFRAFDGHTSSVMMTRCVGLGMFVYRSTAAAYCSWTALSPEVFLH